MRVLVTRPEPGASETAARLEALGHRPILLPLSEIRPLAPGPVAEMGAFAAVAATSANALRHAPGALVAALSSLPCFAVGETTANAARDGGFSDVRCAMRDAAALAQMIAVQLPPGTRIAYICGRVRRSEFEASLAKSGFGTVAIETYDTVRPSLSMQAMCDRLGGRPVDAALVHSALGAEALGELALDASFAPLFAETRYLCLSARVAAGLGAAAASRASVSPEPTETALISLLGAGGAA